MLSIKLHDDDLETPFRDLAVSIESAEDTGKTLDEMYKALKESYINVRNEKACVVHAYKEEQKLDDERNHQC